MASTLPHRIALYTAASLAWVTATILYAVGTRIQFYPTMIFLSTSKFCAASLINLGLLSTLLFGLGCGKLFFGRLRDAETEQMWEHLRFSVTELAFALTTFREEINLRVGFMFGLLLFAKVFHLLQELRVESVEHAEQTTKFHVRIVSLAMVLSALDLVVLAGCAWHLSQYGVSVQLLFAFEHAILFITLQTTMIKYFLTIIDLHFVQGRWQNKSHYEMIVSIVSEGFQFVSYFVFAVLVFSYYGVPIHLMRNLYVTFRNLVERTTHFIRFRRIMTSLNDRFPDATQNEVAATDGVCIICRDEMCEFVLNPAPQGETPPSPSPPRAEGEPPPPPPRRIIENHPNGKPKKLACGHIFHSHCLQGWLERQFTCPTCRSPVSHTDNNNARQQQQQQRDRNVAARQARERERPQPMPEIPAPGGEGGGAAPAPQRAEENDARGAAEGAGNAEANAAGGRERGAPPPHHRGYEFIFERGAGMEGDHAAVAANEEDDEDRGEEEEEEDENSRHATPSSSSNTTSTLSHAEATNAVRKNNDAPSTTSTNAFSFPSRASPDVVSSHFSLDHLEHLAQLQLQIYRLQLETARAVQQAASSAIEAQRLASGGSAFHPSPQRSKPAPVLGEEDDHDDAQD